MPSTIGRPLAEIVIVCVPHGARDTTAIAEQGGFAD
jgi:hypothetical protein